MTISDLYGFKEADIHSVRAQIEGLFGLPMEVHESSYVPRAEYYELKLPSGERLSLQANHDEEAGEWAEEDFPTMVVLLTVEGRDQNDELRQTLVRSLAGIEFLQREVCTSDRRFLRIRNDSGRDVVIFEKDLTDDVVALPRG
jgi:hypothetical protein